MDVELERAALPGAPALRWTPRRLLPVSDDRLAQMVKTGHEQAFATLYERYHQRLYRYCRSILGNESDAQDALQSAFARAFAALAEGRRDAPVRPWLYRIAHNESVSVMRRRRPEVEIAEDHIPPVASAAEVADQRSRLALLMADLAELTERQRAALVMRELGGLSHAEIATALTIDLSAAKQTIFEARRSLQEFAEGRAMLCDDVCRAISDGGGRTLRGRRVKAHLRDCRGCAAFAAAIPARARDLRAVAPPLAGIAAVSILRRVIASTPSPGGGGGGLAAGTAGKAAGMLAAGKALAGAAAVATLAAGASAVVPSVGHPQHSSTPSVSRPTPGVASGRPARSGLAQPASSGHRAASRTGAARSLTRRAATGSMRSQGHGRAGVRDRGRARGQWARTARVTTPSARYAHGRPATGAAGRRMHGRVARGSTPAATRSRGVRRSPAVTRRPASASAGSRSVRRASPAARAPVSTVTQDKPGRAGSGAAAARSTVPAGSSPVAAPTSSGASANQSPVWRSTHQRT